MNRPFLYTGPVLGRRDATIPDARNEVDERARKHDDLPEIFIAFDHAGEILYVNRQAKRQLVRFSEREAGHNLANYCHPDDFTPFLHGLNDGKDRFSRDCRLLMADGRHRWFLFSASAQQIGLHHVWYCICIDIHQRIAEEKRLRETSSIQSDMLGVSVDCIKVIAPDGGLLHMNHAGCVALGVAETGAFGMPWLELLPAPVRADGLAALAHAREGRVSRFSGESHLPDTAPRYWDNMLTPVRDERGLTRSILCVSRDVTSQKEAELRLQLAVRATNDVIWDWNIRTGQMIWNDALERRFGHRATEVGCTLSWWLDQIHPHDRAGIREKIDKVLAGSRSEYVMEYRFRRADGVYADILDRGFISRHPADQPVRMVGAMFDQTDRKAIERNLFHRNLGLEKRARNRSEESHVVWDSSPDVLLSVNAHGMVKRANRTLKDMLGLEPEQLVGTHFSQLVSGEEAERFQRLPMAGVACPLEMRHTLDDGVIKWVSWITSPHGQGFIASGSDITLIKDAQAAVSRSESAIAELHGITELGLLTGSVAHDFNNLLGVIRNWTHLLQRTSPDSPQREKFLEAILNTTDRAANLTATLLMLGRSDSRHWTTFDVVEDINALQSILSTLLGPRISLDVSGPRSTFFLDCDPYQFDTAIINLAINARDAMSEVGCLRILVDDAQEPHNAEFFTVSVSDNGCGIAEADQSRIFEAFFTTKARGKGTGLGLSQVTRFIRDLGGEIELSSELGLGTTFMLRCPRSKQSPNA